MKTRTFKLIFPVMIMAILSFSGCALSQMIKASKDQALNVDPNPLEVHADSVRFDMSANLPTNLLKPGKVYTLNTYYRYGTQERQLKSIEFRADDYTAGEQPSVTESYVFPYDEAMMRGNVEIQGRASNPKNGSFKETERLAIAEGVITTSTLVQPSYAASYADHGYNDQEELIPTNVEFFFDQGRSVFKTSEKNSDRGSQFTAFIAEKNVTRTVTITGTHSPEGKETFNSELAQERADAIEKWYREQMDKYDYQGMADEIRFILKPIVQDWTDLKAMLASYNGINASQKSEWTRIINGTGSFEQKEKQLQKLSTYSKVFEDIYPQLRTAKTEVLTVKEKRTPAEIATKALQANNNELSVEELAYAAANNPSLEEKKRIYEKAAGINDTWVIHNNLGAVHLEMAMQTSGSTQRNHVTTALNHFNISNQKKANVEAQTNMAMAMAMQGNLKGAHENLVKALGMSPNNTVRQNANGTKGFIEAKLAMYSTAVSTLNGASNSSVNTFNKGLAQLLNGNASAAQTTFETVIRNQRGYVWAHYAAAVAAARQDNENKVIEHLRNAINADSSLKEKAMNDLEFRNYTGTQAFMNLMQ